MNCWCMLVAVYLATPTTMVLAIEQCEDYTTFATVPDTVVGNPQLAILA